MTYVIYPNVVSRTLFIMYTNEFDCVERIICNDPSIRVPDYDVGETADSVLRRLDWNCHEAIPGDIYG